MARKLRACALDELTEAALWLAAKLQEVSDWLDRFYLRYNRFGRMMARAGIKPSELIPPCEVCRLAAGYAVCCKACGAGVDAVGGISK